MVRRLTRMSTSSALLAMSRRVCLFGHTHLPAATALGPDEVLDVLFHGAGDDHRLAFGDGRRYLINPGSVGQPRDGDPRAAYAILDTTVEELVIRRVAYRVEQACERILAAGLPPSSLPLRGSLFPALEFDGERVPSRARSEKPADDHPDEHRRRDVDEMTGPHLSHELLRSSV
jgi:diadenosine tetraphosphatase ApaH/serine/threonine PP2A family protein phosphatase